VQLGGPSALTSPSSGLLALQTWGFHEPMPAGDLNGDGFDDVLERASRDGNVSVFFGSASGLGTTSTVTLTPPPDNATTLQEYR
jgi:hypothetical protein